VPHRKDPTGGHGWVLGLMAVASFMVALDQLVLASAMDSIRAHLHASIGELQRTVTAYSLSFAVLLLTASAIGDRFGRRMWDTAGQRPWLIRADVHESGGGSLWTMAWRGRILLSLPRSPPGAQGRPLASGSPNSALRCVEHPDASLHFGTVFGVRPRSVSIGSRWRAAAPRSCRYARVPGGWRLESSVSRASTPIARVAYSSRQCHPFFDSRCFGIPAWSLRSTPVTCHEGGAISGHAGPRSDRHFGPVVYLAAIGAVHLLGDFAATGAMRVQHGWTIRGRPPIAPFGKRHEDGHELATLLSEQVLVELRILRVDGSLHDSRLDETVQAGSEDVRRDAEALVEVAEAGGAGEQGVSHDEKSPPLADEFERARRRAHLGVVRLTEHPINLSKGLA
jgi:hypothetical protein